MREEVDLKSTREADRETAIVVGVLLVLLAVCIVVLLQS